MKEDSAAGLRFPEHISFLVVPLAIKAQSVVKITWSTVPNCGFRDSSGV